MSTSANIINTLGAGSGIDTKSLAENLVEAERFPRKQRIDEKIAKSEAKISGLGAMKYALSTLKSAFSKLNDASDFSSLNAKTTQPNAFGVSASSTAQAAIYTVQVDAMAKAQRSDSNKFAARNTSLNGGAPFDLSLTVGNQITTINVSTTTPAGIASAINGAKIGITARLIDTGSGFQIVLTGQEGLDNSFSISNSAYGPTVNTPQITSTSGDTLAVTADSDATGVLVSYTADGASQPTAIALEKNTDGLWVLPSGESIPDGVTLTLEGQRALTFNLNQNSQNSQISVNGVTVTRPSNQINDVIEGVTLDLYAPTVNESRLDLTRNTTDIKQNIRDLVTAYNDFQASAKILGDRKSEVEEFGGALAGESLLSSVQNQVRALMTDISTTPGTSIQAARHVGLSIDRLGVLQLDETKLDAALQDQFDEVITMFSAGTNNKSVYSTTPAGLAGRAVKTLDEMMRSTSLLTQQTDAAKKNISQYQEELSQLESRMEKLLTRYTKQFSAMESIVGESNSMRASLKNSFSAMLSSYGK